ncbi:MAG: type I DNA topoisomerase [Deltaproteobacteria bacterium]|jgi:DNA topoisomerase-1|nr:type I DNA topoisomerase [Deltaproteobacteria bacterium]
MSKDLLIVESPAKAKTIGKYLGSDFEVLASVGHIYDLPKKRLGVDLKSDFEPEYEAIEGKKKVINDLKKAAKGKKTIYLGADPDREGEAIAWHIAQSLGLDKYDFKRVLFNELTPSAIKASLASPVSLSKERFESQQTRRILDRLVGYLISPILWDKLKRGLSAGRVQSVALRLLVEREKEIFAFIPEEKWSLTAEFENEGLKFEAILFKRAGEKFELKNQTQALAALEAVKDRDFKVIDLVSKDRKRTTNPPFTTSTLQQNAYHRLHFDSSKTMRLAQELYEGIDLPEGAVGLITYMRTDSVRVSDQAADEASDFVRATLGETYLPKTRNFFKNKKGAQDAHEAVRPTSVARSPEKLKDQMPPQHWQLYDLIWRRFVASQMAPSIAKLTTVELEANQHVFKASGSVVVFKGFLAVYDPGLEEDKNILPPLALDQNLKPISLNPKQHFTQPPPRFNEATLVKELEEKGIGRPSTYAAIIKVLRDKEYVESRKGPLRPTEMGLAVNSLLVDNFPEIMNVTFTAGLEENLDQIEEGDAERLQVLRKLYDPLAASLSTAKKNMLNLKIDGFPVSLPCPSCHQENSLVIKYGRNGFYLSCKNCGYTNDYSRDEQGRPQPAAPLELVAPLTCEKCGRPMAPKKGRYGFFLACTGYPECKNAKPLKTNEEGKAHLDDEAPPDLPPNISHNCPKCGKPLVVKKTRKGNWFIACSGYPKCTHAQSMPTGFNCPRPGCSGQIVEKFSSRSNRAKDPFFYGCSNYPQCRLILKGVLVASPCPDCGCSFRVKSNRAGFEEVFSCPNPECPTRKDEPKKTKGEDTTRRPKKSATSVKDQAKTTKKSSSSTTSKGTSDKTKAKKTSKGDSATART